MPSGEILSLEAALDADQVRYRNTIQTIREEGIGDLKLFNLTARFEKTPATIECPPPRLGAHTREILQTLGYSEEEVKRLKEKGIV